MMNTKNHRPNVLVFLTDQQRWDTSGLHGNPLNLMPNFDNMAQEGTHFYNAISCQPVCGPARSCMQTGMYATNTGVFKNGVALREDAETLAKAFGRAGYQTAYVGKWHLGGIPAAFNMGNEPVPVDKRGGYEYWLGADVLESVSDAYETYLFNNNNERVFFPGYRADAVTDAAINYVAREWDRQRPFFLFTSLVEPHYQNTGDDYPPPTGYREPYTGRWVPPDLAELGGSTHQHLGGYFGMVKRIDEAFGRMLDALKSMRLLEDTVVLFTSDHGCHFKTRNGEYKRSVHESSVRVPMAARGPGFDRRGRVDALVSLVDLAPTVLDAAGLDVPESMDGRSAMPLVDHSAEVIRDEVFIQISESEVGRAIRTRRWKYGVTAEGGDGYEHSDSDS